MNTKEKRQEEQELANAVSVLRATLRGIAHRKACRYEQVFLHRVRDMIDEEIGAQADTNAFTADYVARKVKQEMNKQ